MIQPNAFNDITPLLLHVDIWFNFGPVSQYILLDKETLNRCLTAILLNVSK